MEKMCLKFCSTLNVVINNGRNVYIAIALFIPSPYFHVLLALSVNVLSWTLRIVRQSNHCLQQLSVCCRTSNTSFSLRSLELFVIACCYVLFIPALLQHILHVHLISIINFHRTLLPLYSHQNYIQCVHKPIAVDKDNSSSESFRI